MFSIGKNKRKRKILKNLVLFLRKLTKLTNLDLDYNKIITNKGIKRLTSLTYIDLSYNEIITDKGIKELTNLTNICK